MRVAAAPKLDVQSERCRMRKGTPELLGELDLKRRASERCGLAELDLIVKIRPSRQIESDLDKCLVERHSDRGKAAHPGLGPEGLKKRLAQDDAGVLDAVMGVDLDIAARVDLEVVPPWWPSWANMWSKKGSPVATVADPDPSRSNTTVISVSLVDRVCSARGATGRGVHRHQAKLFTSRRDRDQPRLTFSTKTPQ